MIVGADTMIPVWGFRGKPSPRDAEQEREMKRRFRILPVDLSKRRDPIVVSAITVALRVLSGGPRPASDRRSAGRQAEARPTGG